MYYSRYEKYYTYTLEKIYKQAMFTFIFQSIINGFLNVIERYILKIVAKHGQGNFYTE